MNTLRYRLMAVLVCGLLLTGCLGSSSSGSDTDTPSGNGNHPPIASLERNQIQLKLEGSDHTWVLEDVGSDKNDVQRGKYRGVQFGHWNSVHDETKIGSAYPQYIQMELEHDTGTLSCNDKTSIGLNMVGSSGTHAGYWEASACQIQIDYISERGGIKGKIISATLAQSGKTDIQIQESPFQAYRHTGVVHKDEVVALTDIPDEMFGYLNITGGTFELREGQHFLLDKIAFTTNNNKYSNGNNDWYAQIDDGTLEPRTFLRVENISNRFHSTNIGNTRLCGSSYATDKIAKFQVLMGPYQSEMVYQYVDNPKAGDCEITVEETNGDFKTLGYTAELPNNNSNGETRLPVGEDNTLTINGQLRNYAFREIRSSDNALATDAQGVSFTITDGSSYFVADDRFTETLSDSPLANGATDFDIWISANQTGDIELRFNKIPTSVGTYTCSDAFTIDTRLGAVYDATEYVSGAHQLKAGAACEIQITQADSDWIKGTFTATLISNMPTTLHEKAQDNSIQISGRFQRQID